MTPESMQEKILELAEHQAICDAERKRVLEVITELKEDVKETKSLTEDIHVLAVNMENMQKTLDGAVKKIDAIEKRDYNEYKETKKIIKNNVLSGIIGAIVTAAIGIITYVVTKMQGGI